MKRAMILLIIFFNISFGVSAAVIEKITFVEKGRVIIDGIVASSNASLQLVKPSKMSELENITIESSKNILAQLDVIDNIQPNGRFTKELRYNPSEEGLYTIRINDGTTSKPVVKAFYNGDFFIGDIVYTDFNNNPLDYVNLGQQVVINAQTINYTNLPKNYLVIVSMYDENNSLLYLTKKDYTIEAGENSDLAHYINVPSDTEIKKIKTMVWDSVQGMIPYVESVEITSEVPHYIYVAADGNDSAEGSFEQPLRTINKALQKAISYRSETGNTTGNITIYLRGGEYFITNSVFMNSAHNNITIAGYREENVVISGGQRLEANDFVQVTDPEVLSRIPFTARENVLQYDLGAKGISGAGVIPKITSNKGRGAFTLLSINGNMQDHARWPNDGYDNIASVISEGSSSDYTTLEGNMIFGYSGTRHSNWTLADNAWLMGYWSKGWAADSVKLNSVDTTLKRIMTDGVSSYGLSTETPGGRYYIFNLIEELDAPGEWYIDANTNILYLYPTGNIQDLDIQLAHRRIQGAFNLNGVSNVTLQNLTIENIKGWGIKIQNSQNSMVVDSIVRNTSYGGVLIDGGFGCGVYSSELYNLGARGIRFDGGERNTLTACGHFAINNEIHDYARIDKVYTAGISMYGVGIQAKHNKIYNAPHFAIQFSQNDNIIEYNEIFNVVTETADAGAIYAGRDLLGYGNIIRYNYIHDVVGLGPDSGNNYVMGVYLDDMWSGTEVYGNIFDNVEVALMLGGGRNNIFENNIIMNKTYMERNSMRLDSRGLESWFSSIRPVLEQRLSAIDYQNEYWQEKYPQAYNTATDDIWLPKYNMVRNNVIYNHMPINGNSNVSQYGTVANNILFSEDIGFVDENGGNLMLKENSIVFSTIPEFKPIPFDRIGLLSEN